jgi:hypothetical protein
LSRRRELIVAPIAAHTTQTTERPSCKVTENPKPEKSSGAKFAMTRTPVPIFITQTRMEQIILFLECEFVMIYQ